ncbi:hypothetical protein NMY22_g17989 [Coprinellus aureogranulatus]|nr:hypothetical protein NMY22_g17989 [Coprinellus aureogranulatus]
MLNPRLRTVPGSSLGSVPRAPLLRPVPLPGDASGRDGHGRPIQPTSEELAFFIELGLLPRPTTAPTVPSPLRQEWATAPDSNSNPARAQTSAGGKLVYFDYKEETEQLNQHGTRFSEEELETCMRLLQDGPQIHVVLLTHAKAEEFYDAVQNKDRVSVHPASDYASIVKWAPSVIQQEALRPFLRVVDYRSAQEEEYEDIASSPLQSHSPGPAVSSRTLDESLTARDEHHHPAMAPIRERTSSESAADVRDTTDFRAEPEQSPLPTREDFEGVEVPATHTQDPLRAQPTPNIGALREPEALPVREFEPQDPLRAQPTPNIGTLREPEALPVREFEPLPERHPAPVAERILAEVPDRMLEALPEATNRTIHPLLVAISATVGGFSMWACLAFGPFDIAFTSPLFTFPVKLLLAWILFRAVIHMGRRLALGVTAMARRICFSIVDLILRAFQFVLESMLAILVRIQDRVTPATNAQ